MYLGPFYRRHKLSKGDPFVMQIDPTFDCDTVTEDSIPKCNRFGQRDSGVNTSNGVFYPASAGSPVGVLIIPIGDEPSGR